MRPIYLDNLHLLVNLFRKSNPPSYSSILKNYTSITLSQLRVLLKVVLPMRRFTHEAVIDIVWWIQRRNHRSYLSHRKRKLRMLNQIAL